MVDREDPQPALGQIRGGGLLGGEFAGAHEPPPSRYAFESISALHCSTNDQYESSKGGGANPGVTPASGISIPGRSKSSTSIWSAR